MQNVQLVNKILKKKKRIQKYYKDMIAYYVVLVVLWLIFLLRILNSKCHYSLLTYVIGYPIIYGIQLINMICYSCNLQQFSYNTLHGVLSASASLRELKVHKTVFINTFQNVSMFVMLLVQFDQKLYRDFEVKGYDCRDEFKALMIDKIVILLLIILSYFEMMFSMRDFWRVM